MKIIIALCSLLMASIAFAQEDFKVIGYLPDYRVKQDDPLLKYYTDIVYFGPELKESGELKLPAKALEHLKELANQSKKQKFKLHLCVGGWGKSTHFATVCKSAEKRQVLIQSLKQLQKTYKLHGVDYDWEYPNTAEEMNNFISLIKETHEGLPKAFEVSAAFNPTHKIPKELGDALDRVHLMTYDIGKQHCKTALCRKAIDDWISNGIESSKLLGGVAFYGRSIEDRNKVMTYQQMVQSWGKQVNQPLPVNGFYFDNANTIQAKVKRIKEKKAGGLIVWEIGQDTIIEKDSLSKQLHDAVKKLKCEPL